MGKEWKDYVNEVIAEFKKAGKKVKLTEILPIAKKRRDADGGHPHKGQASKTRKGRKDFITHKGDKKFNRKGHRQSRAQGSKKVRKPYKGRGGETTEERRVAVEQQVAVQNAAAEEVREGVRRVLSGGRKRRTRRRAGKKSRRGGKKSRRGSKRH